MALETATYINGLVSTNPTSGDPVSEGDDHLRLLKSTIKASFPNVTGAVTATQDQLNAVLTNGTAQASTSGTAINFTSIPSWVKRVTVNLSGVSTNGTDNLLIQLGDSGGIESSGYLAGLSLAAGSSLSSANSTDGFSIATGSAATVLHGTLTLTLLDAATNTWAASGVFGHSNAAQVSWLAGSKALSATLDRVRITTSSGVNTFDAGLINIQYD